MSQKKNPNWVAGVDGVMYMVPEFPRWAADAQPDVKLVNHRDDGETGDAWVDVTRLKSVLVHADGTRLMFKGDHWFLVNAPCCEGEHKCSGGGDCSHDWKITLLSEERAAVFAHAHGHVPEVLKQHVEAATL